MALLIHKVQANLCASFSRDFVVGKSPDGMSGRPLILSWCFFFPLDYTDLGWKWLLESQNGLCCGLVCLLQFLGTISYLILNSSFKNNSWMHTILSTWNQVICIKSVLNMILLEDNVLSFINSNELGTRLYSFILKYQT